MPVLPESQRKNSERKLILWVLLGIGLIALIFFVIISKFKSHFVSIPISQTAGINTSVEFQFTLSPNNRWILYFEQKYPYYDQYNLIAFDTINNKKFTIDSGNVNTAQLQLQIQNNCWSKDSKYCVLPVPLSVNEIKNEWRLASYENTYGTKAIPWTNSKQLTKSQFTNEEKSVGYLNNAPDIIIDFSNEQTGPVIKNQYFDSFLGDFSARGHLNKYKNDRLTFDQISSDGFICSDCDSVVNKEKDFGGNSHGSEYTSPDGRYIAQEISHDNGFVSPSDLYIKDTKTGNKTFIAHNVYYDVHFTSDSNRLYYYGCKIGGACDVKTDHLFYINFSKNSQNVDIMP